MPVSMVALVVTMLTLCRNAACFVFCSTTSCSMTITQKCWSNCVSLEKLYAASCCFRTRLVTSLVLLLAEGIWKAGCSCQTGCWWLCRRFDKSPGSTQHIVECLPARFAVSPSNLGSSTLGRARVVASEGSIIG